MNSMLRKLIYALPSVLQRRLLLQKMEVNYNLDSKIYFKVAETKSELEGAFRLLYDAYVRVNLQKPNDSKMRVTPYHALDSTTTIVAKIDDKVIGTLSLIRWGALGLPADNLVDLSERSQSGGRLAEVSALAIDREYKGQILFHLLKYMYNYCTEYFGVDELIAVIVTKKMATIFYESILQFQPISQNEFTNYTFSNFQKVIVEGLNLRSALKKYHDIYELEEPERNLYYFFTQFDCSNFIFPKRNIYSTSDPVMTTELFQYFYMDKTQAIHDIPEKMRPYVLQKYNLLRRNEDIYAARIDMDAPGVGIQQTSLIPMQLVNLSKNGFCVFAKQPFSQNGESTRFVFQIGPGMSVAVVGKQIWSAKNNRYGFEVDVNFKESWRESLQPYFSENQDLKAA